MEDQRLKKVKMVSIQTGTPGDMTQSYKVIKDMELKNTGLTTLFIAQTVKHIVTVCI